MLYDIEYDNFTTIIGLTDNIKIYMTNTSENGSLVSSKIPICLCRPPHRLKYWNNFTFICISHTKKRNTKIKKFWFKISFDIKTTSFKHLVWYFYLYYDNTTGILRRKRIVWCFLVITVVFVFVYFLIYPKAWRPEYTK